MSVPVNQTVRSYLFASFRSDATKMKEMGTAALADPYATALQSRKSCCVLLVFLGFFFFFIFCVALCFVAAARTDSERNEEKYRKEMKKITPLVIFKFLILESPVCYCHSNLGGFY